MFRWIMLMFFLAAVAAGLVIGVLNPDSADLNFLIFEFSAPLGATVLAALTVGILLGLLLALVMFVIPGRFARRGRDEKSGGGRLTDQSNG